MKKLQGKIISLKREKTATVEVARMWRHPLYGKSVKRSKNYSCHFDDAKLKLAEGDLVEIQEGRPVSKTKRYTVVNKIEN